MKKCMPYALGPWYDPWVVDAKLVSTIRVSKPIQPLFLGLMVAGWAVVVGAGVWFLWTYANRPGPSGPAAVAWPRECSLRLDPSAPTLLIFIHPQCPCSRASMDELDTLLARAARRPAVKAVFVRPAGTEPGWERKGLWSAAAAIPGVEAVVDPEGAEARRFGVQTSGHVLLFGSEGALRFSGGITSARGHAGDNAGLSQVLDRLRDTTLAGATTPVFGCLLFAGCSPENEP